VAGSCGHGNELCDSIKGGESSEYLSDWQLLKKDSAPWTSLVILYYCLEQTMDITWLSPVDGERNNMS
jgi:hypothetical protein